MSSVEPVLDGARIFHVNINCSDLARSGDFYVDDRELVDGVRTTPERAAGITLIG